MAKRCVWAAAQLPVVRLPCGYRYSRVMQSLRYSINVTLDGCCDHRTITPDEDLHRHAAENLEQATTPCRGLSLAR